MSKRLFIDVIISDNDDVNEQPFTRVCFKINL